MTWRRPPPPPGAPGPLARALWTWNGRSRGAPCRGSVRDFKELSGEGPPAPPAPPVRLRSHGPAAGALRRPGRAESELAVTAGGQVPWSTGQGPPVRRALPAAPRGRARRLLVLLPGPPEAGPSGECGHSDWPLAARSLLSHGPQVASAPGQRRVLTVPPRRPPRSWGHQPRPPRAQRRRALAQPGHPRVAVQRASALRESQESCLPRLRMV